MNATQIINTILEKEEVKAGTFAKIIGVNPTQIYDLQSGKTKRISATMADKITNIYPHYNKIWLLTGEGPMLKPAAYQSGMNVNYSGDFDKPIITHLGDGDNTIVGDGTNTGSGNYTSPAQQKKAEKLIEAKAEAMRLRQEIELLSIENSRIKEENNLLKNENEALRKSNQELHKSLIEEKERMIKILLEKK